MTVMMKNEGGVLKVIKADEPNMEIILASYPIDPLEHVAVKRNEAERAGAYDIMAGNKNWSWE